MAHNDLESTSYMAKLSLAEEEARGIIDQAERVDKRWKERSIQRIRSKIYKPPPAGLKHTEEPTYLINEREPALLYIDTVPVFRLFVTNLPQSINYKDLAKFFKKKLQIDLKSVYILPENKCSAFILCYWLKDSATIQLSSKRKELKFRGNLLKIQPANVSNQRKGGIDPKIVSSQEMNNTANVSIAQTVPYDVLIEIFEYLSLAERMICRQVCRHWQGALTTTRKQKYFDLSPEHLWNDANRKKPLTNYELLQLAKYCNGEAYGWQTVILSGKTYTANLRKAGAAQFLRALNPHLLSELNLCGVTLSPSSLKSIATNFHQLKSFTLGDVHGCHDEELSQIIRRNQLQTFGLVGNNNTSGKFFIALDGSETLTTLLLIPCSKLASSLALKSLLDRPIELRYLHIAHCASLIHFVANSISIRDNSELRKLHLESEPPQGKLMAWNQQLMIDEIFMSRYLPNKLEVNLESLCLAYQPWVTTSLIQSLVVGKKIRHLDISGCCADNSWWSILSDLESLEWLAINALYFLRDKNGSTIHLSGPPILNDLHILRHKIRRLEFRNYEKLSHLPRGMSEFFKDNHVLQELDIRGCENLKKIIVLNNLEKYRASMRSPTPIMVRTDDPNIKWNSSTVLLDRTPYERPENLPNWQVSYGSNLK